MENDDKVVSILYTNWKGKTDKRNIIPRQLVFTSNEFHKQEQWCIEAFDIDKNAMRIFACKDIKDWDYN